MCLRLQLSSNRRVTLSDFKGMTLVSIREYYLKDGKEMPSSKGTANLTIFLVPPSIRFLIEC
jgi:hypothetical protein